LHQIGIGMKLYVNENSDTFPPGDSAQFDPKANPDYAHGNALGGTDPSPVLTYRAHYPAATNRLLYPCVPGREAFRCPADRGFGQDLRPTVFDTLGCSYRFNWQLEGDYYQNSGVAEDPAYNLGLKKESWPPEPSRFIMMQEMGLYPWHYGMTISITHCTAPRTQERSSTLPRSKKTMTDCSLVFFSWTAIASSAISARPSRKTLCAPSSRVRIGCGTSPSSDEN